MEKPITSRRLLKTDSIQELSRFWDAHDLTDFHDELEDVTTPVFERTSTPIRLPLSPPLSMPPQNPGPDGPQHQ
jgi:hypothetical protein